jgi:hypothetical protein
MRYQPLDLSIPADSEASLSYLTEAVRVHERRRNRFGLNCDFALFIRSQISVPVRGPCSVFDSARIGIRVLCPLVP